MLVFISLDIEPKRFVICLKEVSFVDYSYLWMITCRATLRRIAQ